MAAACLSRHALDAGGRCKGCPRGMFPGHCAFEEPYGDGRTCLRAVTPAGAVRWVGTYYHMIYAGQWPVNPWQWNHDEVQRYCIVSNTIANLEKENARQ